MLDKAELEDTLRVAVSLTRRKEGEELIKFRNFCPPTWTSDTAKFQCLYPVVLNTMQRWLGAALARTGAGLQFAQEASSFLVLI